MNAPLTGSSARVLAVHHLWAHVLQGPAHCHEHIVPALVKLLRQPEVDDPEVVVILDVGEHDVEGLQVQVQHSLIVDKVDASDNLQIYVIYHITHILFLKFQANGQQNFITDIFLFKDKKTGILQQQHVLVSFIVESTCILAKESIYLLQ